MANRYFNKQVTESRKPLAAGGPIRKPDPKGTGRSGKPGSHLVRPIPKGLKEALKKRKQERDIKRMKNSKPELKALEGFRKVPKQDPKKYVPEWKHNPKITNSKPESPERKKRQADYMKKHGKKPSSRKTLSVTNSYKKEVEGLK
tara:strand:+ start:281 stop:715 length:435 start_codon:yes stop_codon:yes gene_type:complete